MQQEIRRHAVHSHPAAADADRIKSLLLQYIDLRIGFYTVPSLELAQQKLDRPTDQVEEQLWSVVRSAADTTPTPITALTAAGMNDVFNTKDATLAGRYNRIPLAAWALLGTIVVCSTALIGYHPQTLQRLSQTLRSR